MSTIPARPERLYLEVPFPQKDDVKRLGARWDQEAKHWYVTEPDHPALTLWRRWAPTAPAPQDVNPIPTVKPAATTPVKPATAVPTKPLAARVEPDSADLAPCVPSLPNPAQVAPQRPARPEVPFGAPWVWLEVPTGDEPHAVSLGALYDFATDTFYVREDGTEAARLWPGIEPLPGDLTGEDRSFGRAMYPELGVGPAGRHTDAFDYLGPLDAARLKQAVTTRVRACELCHTHVGRRSDGSEITLTAWGRWRYDDAACTRTLVSLIATCRMCEVTSRQSIRNAKGEPNTSHVLRVEQLTGEQAEQIVALWDGAEHTRDQRAGQQWSADVSLLSANGLSVREPVVAPLAQPLDAVDRYWISVPADEQYEAHRMGASYAPAHDAFWVLYPGHPAAQRWPVSAPLPPVMSGEDRQFGTGETLWELGVDDFGLSILELLTPVDAVRVRAHMASRGTECEVCGTRPNGADRVAVKVCGRWAYDDETRTRTLRRVQWLCARCSSELTKSPLTPTGLATKGARERAERLGIDVNVLLSMYTEGARRLQLQRRPEQWTYDLGFLAGHATLAASPRVRTVQPPAAKPAPDEAGARVPTSTPSPLPPPPASTVSVHSTVLATTVPQFSADTSPALTPVNLTGSVGSVPSQYTVERFAPSPRAVAPVARPAEPAKKRKLFGFGR